MDFCYVKTLVDKGTTRSALDLAEKERVIVWRVGLNCGVVL